MVAAVAVAGGVQKPRSYAADAERTPPSPRRLVGWLMSRPDDRPAEHRAHIDELIAACPHLTTLVQRIRQFASLLTNRRSDNPDA